MHDEQKTERVIAYIVTALILFGVPFGIGLLVGHFCW